MIITQLAPDEWQKYRDIRLLALKSDPSAFASSYDEEIGLSKTEWQNRIKVMWFALDHDQPVGLVGLLKREYLAIGYCADVISLWVKPAHRGQGIAKSLLENLQNNAESFGLRKLSLQVSCTQPAAIKLYEKLGFTKVGLLKDNLFKNGKSIDEYQMEWLVTSS